MDHVVLRALLGAPRLKYVLHDRVNVGRGDLGRMLSPNGEGGVDIIFFGWPILGRRAECILEEFAPLFGHRHHPAATFEIFIEKLRKGELAGLFLQLALLLCDHPLSRLRDRIAALGARAKGLERSLACPRYAGLCGVLTVVRRCVPANIPLDDIELTSSSRRPASRAKHQAWNFGITHLKALTPGSKALNVLVREQNCHSPLVCWNHRKARLAPVGGALGAQKSAPWRYS